ncbi:hypothetical protein COB52_02975 [Candidatus Kaiserbacteria bacterium]|nr:MAG: hypothetical protein COB52_02975 [Candidatus Kaiserbacteria bacterium]
MKVTPKDFFLWAGAMFALYFSVGSFMALMFEYIDRLVGNSAVIGADPYSGGMTFAIASLIVLFPVYIVLTRILQKDIRRDSDKKELWVRRWLIILTIFGAGVGLIIDLIVLINTFLGGEALTAAFLLKILTVFVLFGGVFYYYIQDVRGVWERNEAKSKKIGFAVSAILAVSIVAGFFIMGSPQTQRELRFDAQRIENLRMIQNEVTSYYRTAEKLPSSLETLKDPLVGSYIENDPETGDAYEYTVTGALTFELCATFNLPLTEVGAGTVSQGDWRIKELQRTAQDWAHDAGRACFEREVDPDRLKPTLR